MGPKKGLKAGSKAALATQAAQKPFEGLAEVAAAYLRFRKSPASLKVLKKAAAAHPSALAELCLAKAALLLGVQAAIKADAAAEGEAVLLAAAHVALEHVVTAAVEHRSLVALNHALFLVDNLLLGMPDWEPRHVQRMRLLAERPAVELVSQGTAAFEQLGHDVVEQELWQQDVKYTWKDGRLQDAEASAGEVLRTYQQMAAHVASLPNKDATQCYDAAAIEARETKLDTLAVLGFEDKDELQTKLRIIDPLSMRLLHHKYLPMSDHQALAEWVYKQKELQDQELLMQRQQQHPPPQQQRKEEGDVYAALDQLMKASEAQLNARRGAQQLSELLKQQLQAECGGEDTPGGGAHPPSQALGVAALLRLASLPLPDFHRLLAEEAGGGTAAEPGAAAAGVAGADAAVTASRLEPALQLLQSGCVGVAHFELPVELQKQLDLLHDGPTPSTGSGGSSCNGGGNNTGRQRVQRLLQQLVSEPQALAERKRQLCEEVPELQAVLSSELRPPEAAASPPSNFLLPDLDLPPSVEAIMPEENILDAMERDADALRGPIWRGRSHAASKPEVAGRPSTTQPDICTIQDNRASRCFDPMFADLFDFGSGGTSLSQTAAVHLTITLLNSLPDKDFWQSKTEMFLKHVLLGQGLVEAVLEHQEQQQHAARLEHAAGSCEQQTACSGRSWMHACHLVDSDDEAAGAVAGTFMGANSPRSPGSPGATAAAAAAAATSRAAAAPAAAFGPAAISQLAQLHAAAAGIHTASLAELLSRIVPEGKQRQRGMWACAGAIASAKESSTRTPAFEAGYLVLQLLPLPDELLSLDAAGAGTRTVSPLHLQQLRRMVLRRILAAMRHLASQRQLYSQPMVQRAVDYVSRELQFDSQLGLLPPGSEQWAPWNRLGVVPLSELLIVYGALAAYYGREFAAGPAALGPDFEDAVAHELNSVQLLPGGLVPADCRQAGDGAAEGERQAAASCSAPVLGLSRQGLASMVQSAAAVLPTLAAERSTVPALVRKSVCRSLSMPASLPPAALPDLDQCARALALCAKRVPALLAASNQLRGSGPGTEPVSALSQLRRLQLWRNLTLQAYHCSADLADAHLAVLGPLCAKLLWVMDHPAGQEEQGLSGLLCGAGGERGLLRELAECCRNAGLAFAHETADVALLGFAQDVWLWTEVLSQLRALLKEARAQAKKLSEGSTARRTMSRFSDKVTLIAKEMVAERLLEAQRHLALLNSHKGALEYVRSKEPKVKADWLQLARCADMLLKLRVSLQQAGGSDAAVRAVLVDRRDELRGCLLEAQTTAQERLVQFLQNRMRMFCLADFALRSETSVFVTRFCLRSPLESLAQPLIEHALPRKWAQQLEAQQAAAGLLGLNAAPAGQLAGDQQEPAVAAQGSKEQAELETQGQQEEGSEQERQQQAEEQANRQLEARKAEAVAAALLEEEEQQAEKQAKERQRKEQAKKQAAQQRAAAAAAAAAAKRKTAEEEATAAAAAAVAARQEAQREAEQRRQAELEEERRRQELLLQVRLLGQTRKETELLKRQRQPAEQRRQQQESEQRRQQQEMEQRRQQEESEQRRQQQAVEQQRQQRPLEQQRQQRPLEQQRQQRPLEQQRQQRPLEQQLQQRLLEQQRRRQAKAQAEVEQREAQTAEQSQQQQLGTEADAAVPAIATPDGVEQLSARRTSISPAAAPGAAAAAPPAQELQQEHSGTPPQLQAPLPQQQPQVLPPTPARPAQQHAALPPQQLAAPAAPSDEQAASIDWAAEAAAAQQLYGANGELDLSKLSLDDAVPSGTAGTAPASDAATSAVGRPRSGVSAGRVILAARPSSAGGQRPGSAGGQRPGSADAQRPGSADGISQDESPPARFVSWTGAWVCKCGQRNESIKEHCRRCNALDPCLRWFQGRCDESFKPCRLPHLWFDLPAEKPRREELARGVSLARPHPDFIYKRKPRVVAAKPAQPAVSAWSRPSAAVTAERSWDTTAGQGQPQPQPPQPPQQQAHPPQLQSQPQPQPPQLQSQSQPPPPQPGQSQPEQLHAARGAVPPGGSWAAVVKPAPAAEAAAGQPAQPVPQQQAQPSREEDELARLLGNMGIGASSAAEDGAPARGEWSFDATAPPPAAVEPVAVVPAALVPPAEAPGSWPALGQDAEDAELEAAIQASLADAAATASRHRSGAWQELPPAPHSSSSVAAANDSEAPALAGLRNEAGEYNCFLNVVVQCLWRCAEFREQVAGWDASFCAHDPVLAALHDLFAQLEQQEVARSAAANGGGTGSLPPVDPAPLREALAALPGCGFSLGEMNDAAELLLCAYEKVMEAEAAGRRGAELAATFGLAVREEVHCSACGKTTHQTAYTQYFYNTQATTLQMARLVAEGAASMGALLRDAEAQQRKSCDTDMGGCGALNTVNHFLQGAPRVFTLQVAWETQAPDPDAVAGTLAALDETVDLGEVYQGVDRGLQRYALRSMVCYYGQHYQALVLVPEAGGWLMFDDTRVSRVGSWADVQRKCEAGRIQPSVLFYEAVA